MLFKFTSIKNKLVRRVVEHSFYLSVLFLLVPIFFYFEVCVVLPTIAEEWTFTYILHMAIGNYLLLNIIGNLIYGMFTNTSIKGQFLNNFDKQNWTMCSVCECLRPPRSWHCDTCDICILKRDHHCTYFACCVGYYNHRYFMLFTLDIFISMIYAFYYNVWFLSQTLQWNNGIVILKFIFPLAAFALDFGKESFYIFLVIINLFVGVFTGFLFLYHLNNILKGRITPENKTSIKEVVYNKGWKANIIEVFGIRWYLTWMLPFIHSPLPGNGIEWKIEDKYK